MRNKKRYNVSLNEESVDKVVKILKVAGLTLSGYLTVLVDEFARLTDDSGYSKILDDGIENLKVSDALSMMSKVLKGVGVEKKRSK
jgi:hypothetical protein